MNSIPNSRACLMFAITASIHSQWTKESGKTLNVKIATPATTDYILSGEPYPTQVLTMCACSRPWAASIEVYRENCLLPVLHFPLLARAVRMACSRYSTAFA